jgi:hypothetical protein
LEIKKGLVVSKRAVHNKARSWAFIGMIGLRGFMSIWLLV